MSISIQGVTKRYVRRVAPGSPPSVTTALDDVDLDIEAGQFVSLLGPSGCGKTTLLRMIAGLVQIDEGRIMVGGKAVDSPRRDLCMVFQSPSLLPWRNVLDNVAFPLELDGMPKAQRHQTARQFLRLVGLDAFAEHLPHELSGGMQQRVGIARGLVRNPAVLLMDEPFGALDAQTRETLQADLLRIWDQTKCTIVFVTHSIDEALMLSDRIVVLKPRPGRINRIIGPAFRADRLHQDVRLHSAYAGEQAVLRELLREEVTA
ncbi:ABC transporter ATP-binding protein [Verticiella sediminum]|uniref:ABC transporter ATP-binding protein n=1 Tax=Verticiella sediminum TaxID=1247510 RepID=A0A556AV36_9BURK|nr:ABC transporter ATP-binding protein [Verticiella sediminum]TSH96819.1 ABC transporter ATP-binding protein [Verticiella sediminum]